ncbi:secretion-regulating guanine nucleotide exchange factor-like isoform X2 [Babylonia areolata]
MPCVPLPRVITGGGGHTLIVAADGSLWVCGSNSHGQLGLGHREDVAVLTKVPSPTLPRITHVSGGWDFTVACSEEGDVYTWGSNAFHQLGRETAEKWSAVPVKVEFPHGCAVVCVAAGLRHAMALTVDGSVYAWGHNRKGQVGSISGDDGKDQKVVHLPRKVNLPVKGKSVQLLAGAYHSGVLTDCQEVCVWGCNKFGQLARDPKDASQPTQPSCLSAEVFGGKAVKQIASGWTHNLALTENGEVYSWGRADYGQLGRSCDGSCDHTPRPVAGVRDARGVACGSEHCLALTGDGKLLCWGWNEHGMCGTGNESDVPLPMQVALQVKGTLSVGCGAGHSFAFVGR